MGIGMASTLDYRHSSCTLTHIMATVVVLHRNDLVANVVGLETYSIVVLFCLGISASSEVSW